MSLTRRVKKAEFLLNRNIDRENDFIEEGMTGEYLRKYLTKQFNLNKINFNY
jgi:hypothetical protein